LESPLFCLVPEGLLSENSAKPSANQGRQVQCFFGDSPAARQGLLLVVPKEAVCAKIDGSHERQNEPGQWQLVLLLLVVVVVLLLKGLLKGLQGLRLAALRPGRRSACRCRGSVPRSAQRPQAAAHANARRCLRPSGRAAEQGARRL
jgi:hypothetical protein